MPVSQPLVRHCPLLLKSDQLLLAPYFRLQDGRHPVLQDTGLDISHRLYYPGNIFIQAIAGTITYAELLVLSKKHHTNDLVLCELLGFLNKVGALQVRRLQGGRLSALKTRCLHLMLGISYPPLSYRQPVSIRTLSLGVLRATTPVILATGVVAGLAAAAELASAAVVGGLSLYWLAVFCLSIAVHELAHTVVLARARVPMHILQNNMHLGIIHRIAPGRIEIISSLAGPLAGTTTAAVMALAVMYYQWATGIGISLLVASCHILSLLPIYGDGASLKKALWERNHS